MRRVQLSTLALVRLCQALQPGFSIHHDLLAYPQFEVVYSESFISEPEAQALLDQSDTPQYESDYVSQHATDLDAGSATSADTDGAGAEASDTAASRPAETYELMKTPSRQYLCAIPVIEPPPVLNETATELAKAEEARELARASANGWSLVNGLDGTCLYYMSGWWSYSFCYGHDIVQFHALPGSVKAGPPVRDPTTMDYVLGRVGPAKPASRPNQRHNPSDGAQEQDDSPAPPNTELQVKGDQRYLVQKMDGGTVCDLTGRDRTIEVQYHCSPGATSDRIGWIKEVTTCSYLMVVYTPRLCHDVAFQPPKETRANIISCRAIVPEAERVDWHARKTLQAQAAMADAEAQAAAASDELPVIGGVVVGARHMLDKEDGSEPHKLQAPRAFRAANAATDGGGGAAAAAVEVLAQGKGKDGGSVDTVSNEELEKFGISPEVIEELQQELKKLAGEKGWKLEVVDDRGGDANNEQRGIRGVVEGGDDDGGNDDDKKGDEEGGDRDGGQGSEEQFFKEEL